MNGREFWVLDDVSNEALEASLGKLLGAGARLEARVVAHLAEVDARRLHLLVGCSSLYDYCRKRLGLSDYEAFVRIAAARVARKYPAVFGMLDRRELHLTAVCEVRDFLTSANHQALLGEVSGKTKLQIREILAHHFPTADLPASVKKLPALDPLAAGRYRLQLTLNTEQKEKLERARDLLSHANTGGDLAFVIERALDVLLARLEQRRFGRADTPKTSETPAANSEQTDEVKAPEVRADRDATRANRVEGQHAASETRRRKHIANEVRRRVVARDGVRCAFVGDGGRRCEARAFLQFHHRQAWARGGHDGTENLELLCHAHNRLRAEQDFGRARIGLAGNRASVAQAKRK